MENVLRSEDLEVGERFDWWCDLISRSPTPAVVTSDQAHDFRTTIRQLHMGVSRASVTTHPSMRVRRSATLVRRSDPRIYHLVLGLRGDRRLTHGKRDAVLEPGRLMLYDSSHSFDVQFPADERLVEGTIVDVPRSALSLPEAKVERLMAVPLPGTDGAGALLSDFLVRLAGEAPVLHPQDAVRLGLITRDLLTMFLAHHLDSTAGVPPESRQQTLMISAQTFIENNLGDAGLSPGMVAAAHHISLRYLHLVFELAGTTVCDWIRQRRLERCRQDLAEPQLAFQPIRAVAARWGFADASHFSRAFRAAFGMTPGEYREGAAGVENRHDGT